MSFSSACTLYFLLYLANLLNSSFVQQVSGFENDVENISKGYLGYYKSPSRLGVYKHAAVSTDSAPCAKIGQ